MTQKLITTTKTIFTNAGLYNSVKYSLLFFHCTITFHNNNGIAATSKTLWCNASTKSPCTSADIARCDPQPGQYKSVIK